MSKTSPILPCVWLGQRVKCRTITSRRTTTPTTTKPQVSEQVRIFLLFLISKLTHHLLTWVKLPKPETQGEIKYQKYSIRSYLLLHHRPLSKLETRHAFVLFPWVGRVEKNRIYVYYAAMFAVAAPAPCPCPSPPPIETGHLIIRIDYLAKDLLKTSLIITG